MKILEKLAFILPLLAFGPDCAAAPQGPESKPVPTAGFDQTHKVWTEVLAAHVHGDTFDYKKLKADRAKLDQYVASLATVKADEFAQWKRNEQYAFWIDVYNAYTVQRVVDAYPVASIKDLGDDKLSVWDRDLIPLGGLAPDLKKAKLTLNDVENKILRPVFKDARVHAAINCASEGCPPLRAEAFTADRLDKQLDDQVTLWLADTKRNRFDEQKGTVDVSQVFDWFKDDFVRDAGSVLGWLGKFSPANKGWLESKRKIDVKYVEYSWKLNERR